jgi:Tfp pilus assembly protein PilW
VSLRGPAARLVRDERGIGVIELLVVLSILVTVIGMAATLFASSMKAEVDLSERVQAQEQARIALEFLRRDVHCATTIVSNVSDSGARVVLTLPAGCPSGSPSVETTFTWCARANGSADRNVVYRASGNVANCATGTGVTWADYLTSSDVFAVRTGGTKLPKLCVRLTVDLKPADSNRRFRLRDELVLRNTSRTTGAETPCPL